jgi:hypothetical protein
MKKLVIFALFLSALTNVVFAAAKSDEEFIKRLKVCATYKYAYKYDGKKPLYRKISGYALTQTGSNACHVSQDMPGAKTIVCEIPFSILNSAVSSFKNNQQDKMFENYKKDKICK